MNISCSEQDCAKYFTCLIVSKYTALLFTKISTKRFNRWISNSIVSITPTQVCCWMTHAASITRDGYINSSPPGQNVCHFTDDIFRCILVNEKFCISTTISPKFVSNVPIDNNPALFEPMLTRFTDAYMRHKVGDELKMFVWCRRWMCLFIQLVDLMVWRFKCQILDIKINCFRASLRREIILAYKKCKCVKYKNYNSIYLESRVSCWIRLQQYYKYIYEFS